MNAKDKAGSTPIDVATAPWSPELIGIHQFIVGLLKLDLERIKNTRGEIAKILAENGGKKSQPQGSFFCPFTSLPNSRITRNGMEAVPFMPPSRSTLS